MLRRTIESGSSDLHLCAEQPPILRLHGNLVRLDEPRLNAAELEAMAEAVIPRDKLPSFRQLGEVDFSYPLAGFGRFRVNIYRQRGTVALAARTIPTQVTRLRSLTLPDGVADTLATFCQKPNGLVLLTGPTGSGKSTTLAAMIDLINEEQDLHIITLEDPIEYLHRHKRAVVNQREVGEDTSTFARGLRAALREDPDVILVGEMRDLETIRIALEAAETGHLVFSTVHTNGAPATIDRIIDVFPEAQQGQVRIQLASAIQGIVTQRLFRRRDREGRFAAAEVLVATPAVRNLVREGKTHQIMSVIQTGTRLGMRTMESSVKELYERRIINDQDWKEFLAANDQSGHMGGNPGGPGSPQGSQGGYSVR